MVCTHLQQLHAVKRADAAEADAADAVERALLPPLRPGAANCTAHSCTQAARKGTAVAAPQLAHTVAYAFGACSACGAARLPASAHCSWRPGWQHALFTRSRPDAARQPASLRCVQPPSPSTGATPWRQHRRHRRSSTACVLPDVLQLLPAVLLAACCACRCRRCPRAPTHQRARRRLLLLPALPFVTSGPMGALAGSSSTCTATTAGSARGQSAPTAWLLRPAQAPHTRQAHSQHRPGAVAPAPAPQIAPCSAGALAAGPPWQLLQRR